ncbi:MAG TPA: hypothetical protein VLT86_01430 [Vicinamibacterales bacterium]|nr:hypothetical protein [Vicinamibacterales bacterium]
MYRGAHAGRLTFVLTALLSAWQVAAAIQPAARLSFVDLFHEYRSGDADRAVQILSTWSPRQIDRDAKLPPGQDDAWAKAALALFLIEALRESSPGATDKAERLIAEAYDRAKSSNDTRLLTFCRDWYFVGLTSHVHLSMDAEAELRRRFSADPLTQLELGKKAERYLEVILHPDRDGYALGFGHTEVHGTSSHGPYGEDAAKAEHAYRAALALDPTLIEARLRLGRVLWFLDRRDEAERDLSQASREAMAASAPTLVYLANLFLGELNEERGRVDDARNAYETAIRAHPVGQVAYLALGRLLLATGRDEEGWTAIASALNGSTWARQAPDPWRVYAMDDTNWSSAVRFGHLRSQVRQP